MEGSSAPYPQYFEMTGQERLLRCRDPELSWLYMSFRSVVSDASPVLLMQ